MCSAETCPVVPANERSVESLPDLPSFIGAEFVETGLWINNINPRDGSLIARVAECNEAHLNRAVRAAKAAAQQWARVSVTERSAFLLALAEGIESRFEEFVEAESLDTGKPIDQARSLDVPRAIANLRFFANVLLTETSESFASETKDSRSALNYTVRKPLGVIGVICPWNLPLLLLTWKVAPALATGNAVIIKPSEHTPTSATLLAQVADKLGAPVGILNVLHGRGPQSVGEMIAAHPGVDAVTFTGSSTTGSKIMRAASSEVKPLSFELGGKNSAIVFSSADIDAAVAGVVRSAFSNSGQICLCTERVYVQADIFEPFLSKFKEAVNALSFEDSSRGWLTLGPLISGDQRDKVLRYLELATQEGAETITGGGVPQFGDGRDHGFYVQPSVFTGLPRHSSFVREEIFGPVCHVEKFTTEDEVIAVSNDSSFGLAASIWTSDINVAHRVAPNLDVGMVWINDWFQRDLRAPFGGTKLSGIGREGGNHSMDFYAPPSNICLSIANGLPV